MTSFSKLVTSVFRGVRNRTFDTGSDIPTCVTVDFRHCLGNFAVVDIQLFPIFFLNNDRAIIIRVIYSFA